MRLIGLSLGLLWMLAAPCWAESAAGPSAPLTADSSTVLYPHGAASPHPAPPASGGWSGGMVGVLVVLLGAGGGWMLWQRARGATLGRFGRGAPGAQSLIVAETRSLGNRQFLVVAAYGEKKFLLGVCQGRIDMLAPLDDGSGPSA